MLTILILLNLLRVHVGDLPLSYSVPLHEIACVRAAGLNNTNTFDHSGFFTWESQEMGALGYEYEGENLARYFPNATSTVVAWHYSPTHYKVLTEPYFQVEGDCTVGVVTVSLFAGNE